MPEPNVVRTLRGGETRRGLRGALHPRPRLPPRRLPRPDGGEASSATSPGCGSRPASGHCDADAAARDRRRGLAGLDRGARERRPERLLLTHFGAVERRQRAPRRRRARRCGCGRAGRASGDRGALPRRARASGSTASRRRAPSGCARRCRPSRSGSGSSATGAAGPSTTDSRMGGRYLPASARVRGGRRPCERPGRARPASTASYAPELHEKTARNITYSLGPGLRGPGLRERARLHDALPQAQGRGPHRPALGRQGSARSPGRARRTSASRSPRAARAASCRRRSRATRSSPTT